MSTEASHSPPRHTPGEVTARPRGILKNPSFSGPSSHGSPPQDEFASPPLSTPLDAQESKEITLQNTLQNAGHRRSSSAARRSSTTRRQSASASKLGEDDSEKMRLKWDEANLYLAEQESGGRMKITEPKTPYQYGGPMEEDVDDEDVAIDPRFVNVDEMDLAKDKFQKKPRESDIPGLELGEPEDDMIGPGSENDRIMRENSLSRENGRDKHVSVSGASGEDASEMVGMPTQDEQEKHRQFEERRKRHYEMRSVKGLLGHPEGEDDQMDEGEDGLSPTSTNLPSRGINGV